MDTSSITTPTDIRQHTCAQCGEQLVRKHNERPAKFAGRQHCNIVCANRAKPRPTPRERDGVPIGSTSRTDGRYEDLTWLLESGEPLHRIPARLGTTPLALSRWLRRNGHPQLAARFERADVVRAA